MYKYRKYAWNEFMDVIAELVVDNLLQLDFCFFIIGFYIIRTVCYLEKYIYNWKQVMDTKDLHAYVWKVVISTGKLNMQQSYSWRCYLPVL